GFIGLGRMGGGMTHRLLDTGHSVFGYARNQGDRDTLTGRGGTPATSIAELIGAMQERPRVLWAMVPAGKATDDVIAEAATHLEPGDIVVDGGNSNFRHDQARAAMLAEQDLRFVDCGTSGGVWGYEVGYCMMVGGEPEAIDRLAPVLNDLAP